MSIDTTWLRCPNCLHQLDALDARVLGCDRGHRFDVSRHDTVTLLPPKAPRTVGDDRTMLDARASLLESGAYAPIGAAIIEAVRADQSGDSALRIADLGCGTGYYSWRLAAALPHAAFLLGDRSPDAVRMSVRAVKHSTGVVLDIWRPLPIRDAVADVVLDVFSPRNPAEFARILRPGGRVIVVVPTADHLRELRDEGAMLDVPAEKAELVGARFAESGFERVSRVAVAFDLDATAWTQALLIGMGPSAHHADESASPRAEADRRLTISVDVLVFEHPASAG
jgi:23S rRNA (guanine745-N1)-methyltransferase